MRLLQVAVVHRQILCVALADLVLVHAAHDGALARVAEPVLRPVDVAELEYVVVLAILQYGFLFQEALLFGSLQRKLNYSKSATNFLNSSTLFLKVTGNFNNGEILLVYIK